MSEDWSRMTKAEQRQFRADVAAFELKHGQQRRSQRSDGPAWAKLRAKVEQAAREARPLALHATEAQRLYNALLGTPEPPEPSPAPQPRRQKHRSRRAKRGVPSSRSSLSSSARPRTLTAGERRLVARLARGGASLRTIARRFKISLRTAHRWVRRAAGRALDRVEWSGERPGPPVAFNKVEPYIERAVVAVREELAGIQRRPDGRGGIRIGPDAIAAALRDPSHPRYLGDQAPSRRTIARILHRNGLLTRPPTARSSGRSRPQ